MQNTIFKASLLLVGILAISACTEKDDDASASTEVYSTTSTRGDYSEWTLSGSSLTAVWNVIDSDGAIDYTFDFTANCAAPDSYGMRACSTVSNSCADGVSVCPVGGFPASFDIMDVPGVALMVLTDTGLNPQLHIGFKKDPTACSQNVAGDYTMMHTSLGQSDNFGVYRSDADFINVLHADFGFSTPDANATTQNVEYTTGTESEMLIDHGCVDGVRTRGLTPTTTIRSMMTASGLFVLDLPAGQGGLISFKTSNAATVADFSGKSFGGMSFPDNSGPEPVSATFGAVSGDGVSFTASTPSGPILPSSFIPLATAASATAPAFPDFTAEPTGYNASAMYITYPNPSTIPGLFKIDDSDDSGRVILAALKHSGKVIAVGMVYNYRDTTDINPSTGAAFTSAGLYNTGNFILFEK